MWSLSTADTEERSRPCAFCGLAAALCDSHSHSSNVAAAAGSSGQSAVPVGGGATPSTSSGRSWKEGRISGAASSATTSASGVGSSSAAVSGSWTQRRRRLSQQLLDLYQAELKQFSPSVSSASAPFLPSGGGVSGGLTTGQANAALTSASRLLSHGTHLLEKLVRRDRLQLLQLHLFRDGYTLCLPGRSVGPERNPYDGSGFLSENTGADDNESACDNDDRSERFEVLVDACDTGDSSLSGCDEIRGNDKDDEESMEEDDSGRTMGDVLLQQVEQGLLPPVLAQLLDAYGHSAHLFDAGQLPLSIHDHRRQPTTIRYTVLQPSNLLVASDVQAIAGDWSTEEQLQFEAQLVLATAEPLCLEPDVSVALVDNYYQFKAKLMSDFATNRRSRQQPSSSWLPRSAVSSLDNANVRADGHRLRSGVLRSAQQLMRTADHRHRRRHTSVDSVTLKAASVPGSGILGDRSDRTGAATPVTRHRATAHTLQQATEAGHLRRKQVISGDFHSHERQYCGSHVPLFNFVGRLAERRRNSKLVTMRSKCGYLGSPAYVGNSSKLSSLLTSSSLGTIGSATVKHEPLELTVPNQIDVPKLAKQIVRPTIDATNASTVDRSMRLVQEYIMETVQQVPGSLAAPASGGGSAINNTLGVLDRIERRTTRVSILQTPIDEQYYGLLVTGGANLNQSHCTFPLGLLPNVQLYLNQFREIVTEGGRKDVKITHIVPGKPPIIRHTPGYLQAAAIAAAAAKACSSSDGHTSQQSSRLLPPSLPTAPTPSLGPPSACSTPALLLHPPQHQQVVSQQLPSHHDQQQHHTAPCTATPILVQQLSAPPPSQLQAAAVSATLSANAASHLFSAAPSVSTASATGLGAASQATLSSAGATLLQPQQSSIARSAAAPASIPHQLQAQQHQVGTSVHQIHHGGQSQTVVQLVKGLQQVAQHPQRQAIGNHDENAQQQQHQVILQAPGGQPVLVNASSLNMAPQGVQSLHGIQLHHLAPGGLKPVQIADGGKVLQQVVAATPLNAGASTHQRSQQPPPIALQLSSTGQPLTVSMAGASVGKSAHILQHPGTITTTAAASTSIRQQQQQQLQQLLTTAANLNSSKAVARESSAHLISTHHHTTGGSHAVVAPSQPGQGHQQLTRVQLSTATGLSPAGIGTSSQIAATQSIAEQIAAHLRRNTGGKGGTAKTTQVVLQAGQVASAGQIQSIVHQLNQQFSQQKAAAAAAAAAAGASGGPASISTLGAAVTTAGSTAAGAGPSTVPASSSSLLISGGKPGTTTLLQQMTIGSNTGGRTISTGSAPAPATTTTVTHTHQHHINVKALGASTVSHQHGQQQVVLHPQQVVSGAGGRLVGVATPATFLGQHGTSAATGGFVKPSQSIVLQAAPTSGNSISQAQQSAAPASLSPRASPGLQHHSHHLQHHLQQPGNSSSASPCPTTTTLVGSSGTVANHVCGGPTSVTSAPAIAAASPVTSSLVRDNRTAMQILHAAVGTAHQATSMQLAAIQRHLQSQRAEKKS